MSHYSSKLMYVNLNVDKDLYPRYGEGVMSVGVNQFQKFALHKSKKVKGRDERRNYAWIVPGGFYPLDLISDSGSLEDDKIPKIA